MSASSLDGAAKVPEVTLLFWIIKVAATTLGETAGDAVSMSMNLGYLLGSAIFAVPFALAVATQIRARRFHAALYWITIVATTTIGTTLADLADRSLGIGYAGGSALLLLLLLASLIVWYASLGTVAVASVRGTRAETFYWVTILFSQTLGTALGDWTTDTEALGYAGGVLLFLGLLALIAAALLWTRIPRSGLFWAAFILTRPLGAALGDLLDKPVSSGGMALSRYGASIALVAFITGCLALFPQRAAERPRG